jgi:putative transposase
MARALRINIAGGWYHILNRGIERRKIFTTAEDYRHFLELVGQLPERYRVTMHGYVLLPNHYHLLMETPEGNTSAAMHWLNVSYSVWFNRRYGRVGPLFQGRFKSVLVENGAWALGVLDYIHLNPVRVAGLGLDKENRKREQAGRLKEPRPEEVAAWLQVLRGYEWSSYGVYAGYRRSAQWLTIHKLLKRMDRDDPKRAQTCYRRRVEGMLRQGVNEGIYAEWRGRLIIGARGFVERTGAMLKGHYREQPQRKQLERRWRFEDVAGVVAKAKGEAWERFCNRHGDWGRDMVLVLARRHSGLKLKELGTQAGGLDYSAVSEAIRRMERRIKAERQWKKLYVRFQNELLNIET